METSPLRAGLRVLLAAFAAGSLTLLAAAPLAAALLVRVVPFLQTLPSDGVRLFVGGVLTALGVLCVAPFVAALFGRVTEHAILPVTLGTVLVPLVALLALEGARSGAAMFVGEQAPFLAGQALGFGGTFLVAFAAARAGRASQARADAEDAAGRAREEEERRRMLDASVALAEKHEAARAARGEGPPAT